MQILEDLLTHRSRPTGICVYNRAILKLFRSNCLLEGQHLLVFESAVYLIYNTELPLQ